ncbi:hypothetical protein TNCV_3974121 [Trichonephila clavipes]|nr:hypothetical protein TNCV_3974121 [Trichonephila clavipes]
MEGNFTRILLRGGESSTIVFKKPISPKKERFCLRVLMKKEPYYPDQQDESILRADFELADEYEADPMDLPYTYKPERRNTFVRSDLKLKWKDETNFSLTFSVRKGEDKHELNIKEIIAFNGYCDPKKT